MLATSVFVLSVLLKRLKRIKEDVVMKDNIGCVCLKLVGNKIVAGCKVECLVYYV